MVVGIAFAILLSVAWFVRPKGLIDQFRNDEMQLTFEKSEVTRGETWYEYSVSGGSEAKISAVLSHEGYEMTLGSTDLGTSSLTYERQPWFFWQGKRKLEVIIGSKISISSVGELR